MKIPQPHHCLVRAAFGLLLATVPAFAQTPATPPAKDETIELSPFQVNANPNRGYGASETMTGSRVKTRIIDLPYTVNVMTSEFFEDFGIFELADNLTQISGFTGLDVGGVFQLRGFLSSNQLRDGFFRLGRYGSSNIDRMEIIKGSSAAIYGRSSPGGMMNMISKMPKAQANQKVTLNYGDYNTERVTFEATGPLFSGTLGKTNYVLTLSNYKREFGDDLSKFRNEEAYFAVDHVFADGSKLTLMAESFAQNRVAPLAPAPVIIDQKGTLDTTDDRAIGYALALGKVNNYGLNSQLDRGNTSYTAMYEKKLGEVFSTRISGNLYMARRDDYNSNQGWSAININRSTGAAPTSQRGSNTSVPQWGRITEDGGGLQADLLAHYWTNNKTIEHRTLLTYDFNDYFRWDPTIGYAAATNPDIVAWNLVRTVTLDPLTLLPSAPVAYFTKPMDPINGFVPSRKMKRRTTVNGASLRHQSALFDGRLLAYVGARYDSVHFRHRDYLTAAAGFQPFVPGYVAGDLIDKKVSAFKPNVGFNYKIQENFRFFVNYSQSYFIAQGDNPIEIVDPTYKAETADGWDVGFKGSVMDGRVNYTVSGFDINRQNVVVSDIDPITGLTVNRRDGDQKVKGYEVDVNWLMTDEVSFLFSYGKIDSKYKDFGSLNPQAIGRKVQYVPDYNGSLSLKYAPVRGALKGFSANVGVTFVGDTPTETPIAGDTVVVTAGVPTVTRSTEQWKLYAPGFSLWSLGLRYTLPGKSSFSHTLALNVNNALDKAYFKSGSQGANRILEGDHRSVFFTYTLGHKGTKL
ncbi:MAG: TonB-dependent receptor [Lacunisphaera sp.]|nr:TonB-dependent receptor [Lacunisphaera sp.]